LLMPAVAIVRHNNMIVPLIVRTGNLHAIDYLKIFPPIINYQSSIVNTLALNGPLCYLMAHYKM